MSTSNDHPYHINPRVRAYGKARLDIARRAQTSQDWEKMWKNPLHQFPFTWGSYWKQSIEYRVADFAAEIGFFIDVLGLPVNAFNEYSAMFTGPEQEFFFSVTPTFEGQEPTPPDAFRLQFLVSDIFRISEELQKRGISFELPPQPVTEGSNYYVASFRTPNGICIDLCCMVEQPLQQPHAGQPQAVSSPAPAEPVETEEPASNQVAYAPLGNDPDDVFYEVLDRPTPQVEPTYEPVEGEEASSPPPAQPPKPRTYRVIPFSDLRS
ncbi:MAG: VOC family protein [Anaerolineales bacterium]|jgi:catechol 2,3-dioxygenase-like lactoylglutathione lyase family enzyme|nr:VOC family protein [Anaerolineales bacterium]